MTAFLQDPVSWGAALAVLGIAVLWIRFRPGVRDRRRRLEGLVRSLQSPDLEVRVAALEKTHSCTARERTLIARMLRGQLHAARRRQRSTASAPPAAVWFVRQVLGLLTDSRAEVRTDAARVLRAILGSNGSALIGDDDQSAALSPAVAAAVEIAGGRVLSGTGESRSETRVLAFAEMLEAGLRPLAAGLQASQGEGDEALEPLVDALRDRSLNVRRSLCDVLAGVGGERSVEMLTALLRDPSPELRAQAAEALGRLEASSASSQLVDLLEDPVAEVRAAASVSLSAIGDAQVCAAVIRALQEECRRDDGSARTRNTMIQTVVSLADGGRPEFARALAELPRPVASRLATLLQAEGVIERWLAEPVHGDREEVMAALLARAAEVGVIRSLLDALESTDESVRVRCAAALSRSHDEKAIVSLTALLDDSSSAVRAEAVRSIARLDGPAALDALCRAAADPHLGVRSAAASGFRSVLAQRSSWSMAALSPDLDLDSSLSDSRRALLMLATDSDSTVRSEAAGACAYIGSPEVAEALVRLSLEDADQAVRGVSAGALAQCGFAHSRRLLAAALEDADDTRRERAMLVLGRLGGTEAARHLAEALNDPSPRVREAAAAALARVDAAGIADQLVTHLRNPDPRVRARAAAELGRSGAVKCVDALVQALSDPEEDVRLNALHALGEFGRAVRRHEQSLRDRESDPSDDVRKAASSALSKLRETWAEAPETADLARRGRLSDAGVEEVVEAAAGGDLDPLLHALDHRRSARRIAAFFAESDGDRLPVVLALLRNARAADRERAASSLSEALRNGVSADYYIDALRALDADVRLMGVEIIGRVGTPTAVQALLEVLAHDPLSEVRSRAASALAETPREAARAGLQRAAREDPDRIVRSAAGRALEQMREASEVRHSVPASANEIADLDDTGTS